LYTELVNRKAFVEAVTTLDHIPPDQTVTVNLGLSKKPTIENFDGVPDTSILDNHKKTMLTSKFFGAAYSRPEDANVAYGGTKAVEFINAALMDSLSFTIFCLEPFHSKFTPTTTPTIGAGCY